MLEPKQNTSSNAAWDGVTVAKPSGSGTQASPYLIATAENLAWYSQNFSSLHGCYFSQTADIDLNNKIFHPIGELGSWFSAYATYYEGNHHIITNLVISNSGEGNNAVGLWSHAVGYIKNLGLSSGSVYAERSYSAQGAFVGQVANGKLTMENCFSKLSSVSAKTDDGYVGGLVGLLQGSTLIMSNCYSNANVSSTSSATNNGTGGLIGTNYSGTVTMTNCYATPTSVVGVKKGGIIGFANSTTTLNYCYYNSSYYSGSVCGSGSYSGSGSSGITTANMTSNSNSRPSGISSNWSTTYWAYKTGKFPLLKSFIKSNLTKPTTVTFTYNGTTQAPSYDVIYVIASGTYSAVNAGTYSATYSLIDIEYHSWSDGSVSNVSFSWTINKLCSAIPSQKTELIYNGLEQTVSWNDFSSLAFTLSGTVKGINANSYTATFTPTSNGIWSDGTTTAKNVTWTISRQKISLSSAPIQVNNLSYNGNAQTPIWSNYVDGTLTISGVTSAQINAGTFAVSFTPTSNYAWNDGTVTAKSSSWFIDKADNSWSVVPMIEGWPYGNSPRLPTATAVFGTVTYTYKNSSGTTITPSPSSAAGNYTMTATVAESTNYMAISSTVNFVISRASLNIPNQSTILTYTGSNQTPTWNNYNSSQLTIGGTYQNQANAGSYNAKFTPTSNYQWTDGTYAEKTVSWSIQKAQNEWTTVPSIANWTYGSTPSTPTSTPKFGSATYTYKNSSGTEVAMTSSTPIGTYTMTATVAETTNYYGISSSVGFSVVAKTVAKPSISGTSFVYNASNNQGPTITGLNTTYMNVYGTQSAKNVGSYSITIEPKSDTTWSDGTRDVVYHAWSITKASITKPTLKTAANNITYSGSAFDISSTTYCNNFSSSTMTLGGVYSATNAGTYTASFEIKDPTNYQWSGGGVEDVKLSWTIQKVTLTTPTLSSNELQFDTTTKTITVNLQNFNATYMETSGRVSQSHAGTYYFVVSLKSAYKDNYVFSNGRDFVVLEWTISPYNLENAQIQIGGS